MPSLRVHISHSSFRVVFLSLDTYLSFMICYILGWFDAFSQLYRLLGEERRRDVWRSLGAAGRKEKSGRKAPKNNRRHVLDVSVLLYLLLVRTGVLKMEGLC
ncbi:hypothetical protein P168DRAFT_11130 [Aspergillus campestris IBT 28561]|uniref:Uncharacterized protein n=1 Tax=Aspergillus campestris (strain IBT 28561) TaxID=1392248 RepID=A0A2I1DE90_ASPC2|nr:uncharacterized protein P168DRAFT_11130 [Aspergillus campestris IBT 28561]PKY08202.1 hypothetical protein P168DRAFT_11130 [Aspergillus campestris IBT 28561]